MSEEAIGRLREFAATIAAQQAQSRERRERERRETPTDERAWRELVGKVAAAMTDGPEAVLAIVADVVEHDPYDVVAGWHDDDTWDGLECMADFLRFGKKFPEEKQ